VLRDPVEGDEIASLDVELADQRAVVRVDPGRDRRLVVEQLIDRRQVARDLAIDDEADDARGEHAGEGGPEDEPSKPTAASSSSHLFGGHVTGSSGEGQSPRRLTRRRLSPYS
jgi:hypothetical protein